jgi:hypothetical protein
MPEFSQQFRQPAFYGYGDQGMAKHRVVPDVPTPQAPSPAPRAQGQQASLFSAEETRNPQGPGAPTFNASQFRTAQHALPGMSNPAMRSQRVTPAAAPQAPETTDRSASGPRWVQSPITGLGPARSSVHAPGAAGPSPTRWHTPAQAPSDEPTREPRTVTINGADYQAVSDRFGAPPGARGTTGRRASDPSPTPAPDTSGPQHPPQPSQPPATGPARTSQTPAWVGRTARYGGLAVGLAAEASESMNKVATDPKRAGNPKFQTSGGWAKS